MKIIRKLICKLRGEIPTENLVKLGLQIGHNFSRQEYCSLDHSHCWLIHIGDNVTLAPRVQILAHDASMYHEINYSYIAPVYIGNNVFIGAGSIILPGVTIGNNVVIGAGSIVVRDIPDNSVAVGNPAHVVKTYTDFIANRKQEMESLPKFDESYTLRSSECNQSKRSEMYNIVVKTKGGYVV